SACLFKVANFLRCLIIKSTLYKFAPPMRKFIVRFVLLHCLLLFNGYGHLSASTSQHCSYSSIVLKSSLNVNILDVKNIRAFVWCSDQPLKLEVAEIEEEKYKLSSFKKYLTGFNFFTTLLPEQTPGHFFGYIDNGEPFANPIPDLACNSRYATFGVFRI
ncbi:MAG: hypothetical protein KBF45_04010, partial [Cyclobacteriaceae bacterium]|nr:hypothetical protein [Cyclobacteriaceae bacterium]